MQQAQFLEVVDRDEAERRWHAVLTLVPLGSEVVSLDRCLGRVLAEDVRTSVDVPSFDRSNLDGFAVRARDTFGASEEAPARLRINEQVLATGVVPTGEVESGTATVIATGAMLPRGADAVVAVEWTDVEGPDVSVRAACVPGAAISFSGTDMGAGETVLLAGTELTSRETGVLAAVGVECVAVFRRPVVGVISTGDELLPPGAPMQPGRVFDSNGRILCDAIRELGGSASFLGVYGDDLEVLRRTVAAAVEACDAVVLSGGTSKGEGDVCYRVMAELDPGIVVHGVALKPGKPVCLAASGVKPVVVLPGFPTSAVFTFHEFVAPALRRLGGRPPRARQQLPARLPRAVRSERGRLEYLLVGLVKGPGGDLVAYPMGRGSGSVTSFSRADGFVRVERNEERVEAGTEIAVTLLSDRLEPADLVVIGSHCTGLDRVGAALSRHGVRVKLLAVGSRAGLEAARRGECDVAPIHLLDPESGLYNVPFLPPGMRLLKGYRRLQGLVTRASETRGTEELLDDGTLRMVNRNPGSGTRLLIDALLGDRRPAGYGYEPRSHQAVAAAVSQGRADWGVTIEPVARASGLGFRPLRDEEYDFAIPADRWDREPVRLLRRLLEPGGGLAGELAEMGFPLGGPRT